MHSRSRPTPTRVESPPLTASLVFLGGSRLHPEPRAPRGAVRPLHVSGTSHRTPAALDRRLSAGHGKQSQAQVPGTAPGLASSVGRDGRASGWLTCRSDTAPGSGSSRRFSAQIGRGQGRIKDPGRGFLDSHPNGRDALPRRRACAPVFSIAVRRAVSQKLPGPVYRASAAQAE